MAVKHGIEHAIAFDYIRSADAHRLRKIPFTDLCGPREALSKWLVVWTALRYGRISRETISPHQKAAEVSREGG